MAYGLKDVISNDDSVKVLSEDLSIEDEAARNLEDFALEKKSEVTKLSDY